ncbi:hypothetical protein [Paraburkholderia fynbosensis]|uniref:Uncharacterized protein n=1 Tax=Paraburkholderia fynbosensis TaxID=1200993 RepID=A0A6J5H392_9BURK|nr:hypothetical protein [Paraburkholderia fynbosensis]CAB3810810.1 hypothetical protein LMG27177_07487 [Paraburkholderia fynbosensis]
MQPGVVAAINEAQQTIKDHFRARAAEEARSVVAEWKDEAVYPFSGEPATSAEKVERQVFDIVAVNVARHLPDYSSSQPKNRKFQLRMLRQAIERSPEDLRSGQHLLGLATRPSVRRNPKDSGCQQKPTVRRVKFP